MSRDTTIYATWLQRQLDGIRTLKRQNPALFWLATSFALLFLGMWLHEKYWGKAQLLADNAKLTADLTLAETRLSPFKTIALEKYPGRWEDALTKLAGDIQRFEVKLQHEQNRIRTMQVEVAVEFKATWKDNKFPEVSKWIWFKQGAGDETASVEIEFVHDDNRTIPVEFRSVENFNLEKLEGDRALLSFRCTAEPRSSIFEFRTDEIHRCASASWMMIHLKPDLLEQKPLRIIKSELDIVVNNRPEWHILWEKEHQASPPKEGIFGFGVTGAKPWDLWAGPSGRLRLPITSPFSSAQPIPTERVENVEKPK